MFSNLFSSSISLATVTPSLVTVGAPHDFSMTTLRPRGPRVTLTASARVFTPRSISARARSSNRISLAAMLLAHDPEDFVLAQNEVLDTFELDLVAGVLAEQHAVTSLDLERVQLAVVQNLAGPHGDHLTLHRLLLRGVGDDDATLGLLLFFDAANEEPILQR